VKYFVLSIIPAVLLFACTSNNQPAKLSATLFDSSYKPAVFTDKDRMEKIKQAFAAADKLYRDYADSNHLPGLAFGLWWMVNWCITEIWVIPILKRKFLLLHLPFFA
jgi:hypothetical protein